MFSTRKLSILEAKTAFGILWAVVVCTIDEHVPFEVETDASEFAITATLNQNGRPVAFFSNTLQGAEIRHAYIEKEAQAIIETIRHWKHYLTGRHFSIKTDRRSVAYIFNNKQRGKIKNDKIMRWRMDTDLEQKISPQILFLDHSVLLSQLDLTLLTFIICFVTLELPVCSTSCGLRTYHSL